MKTLPIGIQTFEKIRRQDFLYIDKTGYFDRLIKGGYFFFSRPRRFGKSLLISTLEALFQGKKQLFEGLAIAKGYQFPVYPVIRLGLSSIANINATSLEEDLRIKLARIAENAGFSLPVDASIEITFEALIVGLTKDAPLVLLVDEYDKPILDQLSNLSVAEANRNFLRRFFGVLKSLDAHIHMVFLTGITKFAKVSLFSELNNLSDLSGDDCYASLLGWTRDEMNENFEDHFRAMAQKLGCSVEEIHAVFAQMYNGYRFSDANITVYNPWSVINALERKRIANYWYDSGSPKFLMDEITRRLKQSIPFNIRGLYDFKLNAGMMPTLDISNAKLETLLLQAGYLTIKDTSGTPTNLKFHIGFPNLEVEVSLLSTLMEALVPKEVGQTEDQLDQLVTALETKDLESFFALLGNAFFANIPYELHMPYEKYYQTVFHTIFLLLKIRIRAEESTNVGLIDGVLNTDSCIYIIEFKWNGSAAAALQQIKEKDYAGKYRASGKKIIGVGVAFTERNIKEWTHEVLG